MRHDNTPAARSGTLFGAGTKVLLLSAHTDDCEFGMGATISRLVRTGAEVHWVTFCNAWQSLPEEQGFDKDTLINEQLAAADALGVPRANVTVKDVPVRYFPEHRQDILEELIKLKRALQPDLVFCPSLQDTHQDHYTLAHEAQRAFKSETLLGYIFPWNIQSEIRHLFVEVSDADFEAKVASIGCYKSQVGRHYARREKIYSLTSYGGLGASKDLAEPFEMIKAVISL